MTRNEWILKIIKKGKTEEEINKAIIAGNAMVGIKPMTGTEKDQLTFAKLNYKKALKLKK